jgi:hypothetical protein
MRSLAWSRRPSASKARPASISWAGGAAASGKGFTDVRLERATPTPCREAVRRGASVETLAAPMWKLVRRI